jgi:hypothetical protein
MPTQARHLHHQADTVTDPVPDANDDDERHALKPQPTNERQHTMTDNPDLNPDKVRAIIAHAVAGLDPQDRAEREAWCIEHDAHGVRMYPGGYDDPDAIEFKWGGRRLALVPRDVLTGDEPIAATFIPDDDDMDAEIADLLGNDDDDQGGGSTS